MVGSDGSSSSSPWSHSALCQSKLRNCTLNRELLLICSAAKQSAKWWWWFVYVFATHTHWSHCCLEICLSIASESSKCRMEKKEKTQAVTAFAS